MVPLQVLSVVVMSAMTTLVWSSPQVNRDEEVVFYGPYLHWNDSGDLVLVLRGRFFEPERDSVKRRITIERGIAPLLFRYIGKRSSDFDRASRTRMLDRLRPFFADGESGETLQMRLVGRGGSALLTLPETSAGGHFALGTSAAGGVRLRDLVADGTELQVSAVLPADDPRQFATRLTVPPRHLPLLVISDVDDTVRIADVLDRPRMIERVFLRPYEPVPGTSQIYNELARRGAVFHFVSGSPWQVSSLIDEFLANEQFPPATLHCRQLGWDFWNSDPLHTKEFKVATIALLLKQFSFGKVLLIGDDGEHDPEVYSETCKAQPDRVAGIWIRQVNPQSPHERLSDAKDLLGENRVVTFTDAVQLRQPVATIGY